MEEQKQNQLLEAVRDACPDAEFSLLTTMQRGDKMLLLVKSSHMGNIDAWGFSKGSDLWWSVIYPATEKLGVSGSIRTLFVLSDTEFVLYAPALGIFGGVFGDLKKPVSYEVHGGEWHQYYVGTCQHINDVIDYLQKKKGTF